MCLYLFLNVYLNGNKKMSLNLNLNLIFDVDLNLKAFKLLPSKLPQVSSGLAAPSFSDLNSICKPHQTMLLEF